MSDRDTTTQGSRTAPVVFLRQVVAELRKVVWPTRPQVVTYFFVVLVFVMFMMAYVAGLDFVFGQAMFKIFG
ncbi:preprotein translocase, SecE subunit [Aeromicrobium marinum DSM 15272]|uniref:Protein translocase subunit SecE n=1 Tax=Aeromicrobium marinum DSM 15272 TaxID=585531 RepID=E2SGC2_9ACTN|nr:preprotein translocase subunit SecE [Aeromicrobium marinum]EFQ81879.1 preprotein translocase, SecE subunit [Aeromicrobium marinum DSM 15272]